MYNITICSPHPLPMHHIITRITLAIIGLLSNSLLLVELLRDPLKCFRNSSSYHVTNLCISDILTCLADVKILWRSPCVGGVRVGVLIRLPLFVSFSNVVTMAFDRYMSCVHPLKYRIFILKKLTLSLISLQWLFFAVFSTVEIFYEELFFHPKHVIPMSLVFFSVVMYAKAAYELKKKSLCLKNMMDQPSSVRQDRNIRQNEERFFNTILMVSCISLFTFSPLIIYDTANQTPYYMKAVKISSSADVIQWCLFSLFA